MENLSAGNFIYGLAIATPLMIPRFYYEMGSGRGDPSISDIAEQRGYYVNALEKDSFNYMSAGEKIRLFDLSVFYALIAPSEYYMAKNETPYNVSEVANSAYRDSLIDKRDKVMAHGIVDLLNEDDIDKLLVTIGRAHLEGVTYNLSQQLALEEITE